jgi:hypothetical protein
MGYANAIAGTFSDTYVAGSVIKSSYGYPCIWINDSYDELALPTTVPGGAYSIALSGSQIYVAGFAVIDSSSVPCYWHNGTYESLELPDETSTGTALSIAIDGDNIYIVGYTSSGSVQTPCLWTNGVYSSLPLPDGTTGGTASSITAANDCTYICGNFNVNGGQYGACYWVNKAYAGLDTSGFSYNFAGGIAVLGSDVYVTGEYQMNPIYWKNGVGINLPSNDCTASRPFTAQAISISGDNILMAGYVNDYNYSPIVSSPCYWINGIYNALSAPGAKAVAVAVVAD